MLNHRMPVARSGRAGWGLTLCLAAGAACGLLRAQSQTSKDAASGLIRPGRLPYVAQVLLAAQGDRLTKPGKELHIMQGTLTDARGSRPAQLVWELPGGFRFDETGSGKTIAVGGMAGAPATTLPADSDVDLIESLFSDGVESFFDSLHNGAPVRLVGMGFRGDDAKEGRRRFYDVYQLIVTLPYTREKTARPKLYYFDSETRLLAKVRYRVLQGGVAVEVQTEFSNWAQVAGEMIPGRIERSEGGQSRLSFVSKGSGFSPAAKSNP